MTASIATLTKSATETGLLASGRFTFLQEGLVTASGGTTLRVDPFSPPGPDEPGWDVRNSGACSAWVRLHRDLRGRTVYLVVDRANAPLTGNYTVQVNALTAVTYNATSSAPADVDALLAGIVAALAGDAPTAAVVTASVEALTPGGANNAIRLVGVPGATFTTFTIGASTAFPGAAALVLLRELESAYLRVYARSAYQVVSAVTTAGLNTHQADLSNAWTELRDVGEGGTKPIPSGGYAERYDLADESALCFELYDVDDGSDGYAGTKVESVQALIAVARTQPAAA